MAAVAVAAASASAAEPFSIRGFVARMRSVDAAKCHPFGGGCGEGDEEPPPPLPPMEPPPRSRWWAHELAAVRARLAVCDVGGDAAAGGGAAPRKGAKRKGSRSSVAAERAKKRRRVLQFRSLLKNKENNSETPSTTRLHRHLLHMGLLRKQKRIHSRRELALWKKLEEAQHHLLPHENSLTHKIIERMDSSKVIHSSISRTNEADYPINTSCEVMRHATGGKDDIFGDLPLLESSKVIFQTGSEELPTVIEESFITDQSDPDAEPETVSLKLISACDITAQSSSLIDLVKIEESDKELIYISDDDAETDCLPNRKSNSMSKIHGDNMHLKYSDGPALTSYSDLRSKCISNNPLHGCFDTNTNRSQGINKHGTSSATTVPFRRTRTEASNSEDAWVIFKKSTDVSGPVVEPKNHLEYRGNVLPHALSQGVTDSRTTKKHISSQGSVLPSAVSHARAYANELTSCGSMPASTSSATNPQAVRTRTEPANYKDVPTIFNKSTDILGPLAKNHFSYQGSVWPSAVSQGVVDTRAIENNVSSKGIALPLAVSRGVGNTRTNAGEMTSSRSMTAKECAPTSRSSGNVTSNVCHESRNPLDVCAALSKETQDSWYSKVHPIRSPDGIGLAFMKLPGLERMEISSCNVKTGEKRKLMNEQSPNTVRCQKQQLVSSMTKNNVIQLQKNIGLNLSQAGKPIADGVGQDVSHPQQPTMRLMGKTVSVCMRSKDQSASNTGKMRSDSVITEATPLTAIPCQFPQKRSFPCQDFAVPRAHLNGSSDFVARIPSNASSGQKNAFNGVQNQRLLPISSVSSTAKDCTLNFGSQFARPAERNMSMVSASTETRPVELHQSLNEASISRNQQYRFGTPASCRSGDDHNFVGPVRNQSSPISQGLLKSSMKDKYQKSTLLCYDDPSSAPISQPYQISGTKFPSASIISFFDHGTNNSLSRYPSSEPSPSHTSLANISVSATGRACTGSPRNTDGRMVAGLTSQTITRPACADNVSQQPAKRQLVTDRHDFTSVVPNMSNHSPGWSLDDAVGPQVLDFRNKVAGDAAQIWRNRNNNSRVSSGSVPVPAVETRWRGGLVAEAKTTLKPGQNLNDHSKLLYPATFSVDNGVNPVVL